MPDSVVFFFAAEEVISINKKLIKKKRGECVTFNGEHYYNTNDTFQWKKRETTTMESGGRIRISGDRGKTVEISRLEESDTALYSAMIHTAGGLEITRHWLVVRGRYWQRSIHSRAQSHSIFLAGAKHGWMYQIQGSPAQHVRTAM